MILYKNIWHRTKKNSKKLCAFFLCWYLTVFVIYSVNLPATMTKATTDKVFTQTSVSGYTEEIYTAVYAFANYSVTLRNAKYVSGKADDGIMLTDRIYTSIDPKDKKDVAPGWVRIYSSDGKSEFRVTVDIDIGYVAKDVIRFYLRAFRGVELGSEMPEKIRFYSSVDGKEYTLHGEAKTLSDITASKCAAIYYYELANGVNARYIRAVIDCDGSGELWLNEVGAAAKGNVFRANDDGSGIFLDNQGLKYQINGSEATVVGISDAIKNSTGTIIASKASFDTDGITYTLGNGSSNKVTVISDFIGEGRINYSVVPNNIKYIVIHNTGTVEEETDAERYNLRMHTTSEETSWHYTVDENIIYHSLEDSTVGWHAGTGINYESIGIEICVNGAPKNSSGKFIFSGSKYEKWVNERFRKSIKNAAMLVAELLTRYGLSTDAVIQHYDASEKNCPQWLREKNGKYVQDGTLWVEFMGYVKEYYSLLNGSSPSPAVTLQSNVVIPDYISLNDGSVLPVTAIGPDAFVSNGAIPKTITLGKMVSKINSNSFDECYSLEKVDIVNGNDNFIVSGNLLMDKNGNVIFDPANKLPKVQIYYTDADENGVRYMYISGENCTARVIAASSGATALLATDVNGNTIDRNHIVGTGAKINIYGNIFYAIIKGDVNGNGYVDASDYILVKRTFMESYKPNKCEALAMKLTEYDEFSVYDYILLKRHVMGTYDIFE